MLYTLGNPSHIQNKFSIVICSFIGLLTCSEVFMIDCADNERSEDEISLLFSSVTFDKESSVL